MPVQYLLQTVLVLRGWSPRWARLPARVPVWGVSPGALGCDIRDSWLSPIQRAPTEYRS
jgi:hypothetical protein